VQAEQAPGSASGPPLARIGLGLFAVATTVRFGIRAVSDPDAWWHLKAGAYVLSHWRFNGPDPWVPFSTRPFVLTQWLPEVVAEKGYELFGLPAVAWLRCAAMLALISALVWAARRPVTPCQRSSPLSPG